MSAADFQARASRDGRDFEHIAERLLQAEGWTINERNVLIAGIRIDLVATDPLGERWTVECKGSWEGSRPGSKRTDTVKKAIGDAWYLSRQPVPLPHLLLTSHLPERGVAHLLLSEARRAGLFREIRATGIGEAWTDDDD